MDAVVDGTLGIKGDTGLTDDALQQNIWTHDENVMQVLEQRAGKYQARRSPQIIAVGPGTTVFVETSAWELALGDAFREHKCRRVDDNVLANIWVSRDPANPVGNTCVC